MKLKRKCITLVCSALLVGSVIGLTGCRIKQEESTNTADTAEILYQTYCEDSYKGYQMDNTAALTFYEDGTWSIAHCTSLSDYTVDTGTWNVEDGILSMYNYDNALVGNGDGCDFSDETSWAVWGLYHYDNSDGTYTDYDCTYAFDLQEDGNFVLYVNDQTYYYWGQNGHISSMYTHTFTANEFIEAYNAAGLGDTLAEVSVNLGTASPISYYEKGTE